MASGGLMHGQRVDEEQNAGDNTKLGGEEIISQTKETLGKDQEDDIKEEGMPITAPNLSASEEKSQSEIVSVVNEAKKEEGHNKKTKILVPESGAIEPAAETNEVQEKLDGIIDTSASKEIYKDEKVGVENPAKENPESSFNDVNKSVNSEDLKNLIKEPLPAEIPNVVAPDVSEEPGKNDVDLNAPPSIEVLVKDLEVESGSPEEQKQVVSKDDKVETENPAKEIPESSPDKVSELIKLEDSKDTTKEPKPAEISTLVSSDLSEESVKNEVDPGAPDSIEVPVKDLEGESSSPEEQKQEVSHEPEKINANSNVPSSIELPVKIFEAESDSPEAQKEEISAEVVTDVSEAPEKIDTDSNAPSSIEVPVTDLGVECGSPEEQKQEKKEEAKLPCLDGATVAGRGEVVSSSSIEKNTSGDAEEVEKKDKNLDEERPEPPLETKRDLETETKVAQIPFDEGKVIEGIASKNDDGSFKDDVKDSEPGDSALNVAEVSLEGDKLAEKEKDVNIEDDKRDLVEKPTDLSASRVSSEDVKAPEAAEITKDVENNAVASEGGKESTGDEKKSEILKVEDADLVEVTKELSPIIDSSEQVTEEENIGSSKSEKDADNKASEKIEEKKDETSKDVNVEEKKVEEAIQSAIDKTEKVELGAEKEESEKTKDRDLYVTSETGDAKIVKEVTKRDSNNIFAKLKRSIVKAKKAILGKSPGPKPVSLEVKDE